MAKKPKETERLKLDMTWEEAAVKLLKTPAKSTPPRTVKPRKKSAKSKGSKSPR